MKNNNLISIIVPIYNVEEYLSRCVDSLIRQTYKNIEIILVDDGSTDKCGEICDKYAQKDSRIKVIHKQNGGASDARNSALCIAKGDYLLFVDSDDWIEDETCEVTLKLAIENNADIVPFGWNKVYDNGETKKIPIRILRNEPSVEECIKALMYKIEEYGVCNFVCNKLCRKELYEDIRFPKGNEAEDQEVAYKLFHRARKIFICNQPLYNYYQRKGSVSKGKYTLSQTKDRLTIWFERLDFIKKYYPNLESYQLAQLLGDIYICLVLYKKNKKYADFIKLISTFADQNRNREKELSKYNKKIRLHYYCYPLFWLYVKMFIK